MVLENDKKINKPSMYLLHPSTSLPLDKLLLWIRKVNFGEGCPIFHSTKRYDRAVFPNNEVIVRGLSNNFIAHIEVGAIREPDPEGNENKCQYKLQVLAQGISQDYCH